MFTIYLKCIIIYNNNYYFTTEKYFKLYLKYFRFFFN